MKWAGVKAVMVRQVPEMCFVSGVSLPGRKVESGATRESQGWEGGRMGDGPFMLMLSPKWASVRISAQSEIVSEVPPPPAAVSSCFSRRVTAGWVSLAEKNAG